jgi:hypothetical protein
MAGLGCRGRREMGLTPAHHLSSCARLIFGSIPPQSEDSRLGGRSGPSAPRAARQIAAARARTARAAEGQSYLCINGLRLMKMNWIGGPGSQETSRRPLGSSRRKKPAGSEGLTHLNLGLAFMYLSFSLKLKYEPSQSRTVVGLTCARSSLHKSHAATKFASAGRPGLRGLGAWGYTHRRSCVRGGC